VIPSQPWTRALQSALAAAIQHFHVHLPVSAISIIVSNMDCGRVSVLSGTLQGLPVADLGWQHVYGTAQHVGGNLGSHDCQECTQ
jgi:hypothetical protein